MTGWAAPRTHRVVLAALVAAAVGSLGVGGWLVHRASEPAAATPSVHLRGHWRALPAPPLTPRARPLGVFTGREVVYLGGDRHPCAPVVSCDAVDPDPGGPGTEGMTRQGAALDLASWTWRRLAPVPGYVDAWSDSAYAAGRIFVSTARGWFAYDLQRDAWSPFHGRWRPGYGVSALGDRIYGQNRAGTRVLVYDAATARWSSYPVDRNRPRIAGLTVSVTPSGPVLGGYDASKPYNVHRGTTTLVDVWDGTGWRRLPATGQLESWFTWTGRRLVDPTVGTQQKGDEYTWDHAVPYGGTLDPATGVWRPLPAGLEREGPGGWDLGTSGQSGSPWFAVSGRVYDDDSASAWSLPRPDGAAQVFATGVWADGRLVALGGASYSGQRLTGLSRRAWVYTP